MSKPKITIASTPVECDALPEGAERFLCVVGQDASNHSPLIVAFYLGKLTEIDRPLYRVVVHPSGNPTITLVAWMSHSLSEKPVAVGPLGRTMPAFSGVWKVMPGVVGHIDSLQEKVLDWRTKWNATQLDTFDEDTLIKDPTLSTWYPKFSHS